MITYITAFIFYTLAMIGILLIAFMVYKKTSYPNKFDNKSAIKILDSVPIGNKKNLLIVKVNNEKFLIASGLEHTTFLAKLSNEVTENVIQNKELPLRAIPEMASNESLNLNYDKHQDKLSDIQRQFQELYAKDETPSVNEIANNKREMVKNLIRELNKTTNENIEGRF